MQCEFHNCAASQKPGDVPTALTALKWIHTKPSGPGSSVGIATELRAGRSGDRILVGGEIFGACPDRPWGPPSLLYNGYRVFPGGKKRPGRDADPSLPSNAMLKKQ